MTKHAAEVTALADVVRTVFADLALHGRRVSAPTLAALELVEQWIGGAAVTVEQLQDAAKRAHEDGVPLAAREQDRALVWANGAAGNLAYTARKGRDWKDGRRSTMDAALYALTSLRVDGTRDDAALEAIRAAAYDRAATTKRPAPKPPRSTTAKPVRVHDELAAFIGDVASDWLKKRRAVFDLSRRVDDATLGELLRRRGYAEHPGVLAFDRRYGGLLVRDARDHEPWMFGAYACLTSDAHAAPRGGPDARPADALVPVAYAPNDEIYFLDARGAAWCHDTISGELTPFAADGDGLVARIAAPPLPSRAARSPRRAP